MYGLTVYLGNYKTWHGVHRSESEHVSHAVKDWLVQQRKGQKQQTVPMGQVVKRKDVRIYYGTFNPDSTAYANLKAQWEAEGVRVINVYSGFGQGYVQDVFTKARPTAANPLHAAEGFSIPPGFQGCGCSLECMDELAMRHFEHSVQGDHLGSSFASLV